MFAYCLNSPVMRSDSQGTRPVSILERFGDKSIPVPNQKRAKKEPSDIVAIDSEYFTYIQPLGLEQSQADAIYTFITHQFSSLEIISSNLTAIGLLLDTAAAYCGLIAVGFAVPSFGMSAATAGSASAILAVASIPYHALAWLVNRIDIEVNKQ